MIIRERIKEKITNPAAVSAVNIKVAALAKQPFIVQDGNKGKGDMTDKAKLRWQKKLIRDGIDFICKKHAEESLLRPILQDIIHDINPQYYRGVMRDILTLAFKSGDALEIDRIGRKIVRCIDYILAQERHQKQMTDLMTPRAD